MTQRDRELARPCARDDVVCQPDRQAVAVRIGTETGNEALSSTAVVSSAYGFDDQALATLGTVGPTRMDYPATMAAVGAVARYVGRMLADN